MTRSMATAAWLGGLLLGVGCSGDRPLTSCADSVAGVWRAEHDVGLERVDDPPATSGSAEPSRADPRYHVVDNGSGVEIYALFDTTRPPAGDKTTSPEIYAPVVFDLTRTHPPGGARLSGTRSQRVTRDGVICPIRTPAEITGCHDQRLTLRYEIDRGVDWERCRTRPSGRWRSLSLRRE